MAELETPLETRPSAASTASTPSTLIKVSDGDNNLRFLKITEHEKRQEKQRREKKEKKKEKERAIKEAVQSASRAKVAAELAARVEAAIMKQRSIVEKVLTLRGDWAVKAVTELEKLRVTTAVVTLQRAVRAKVSSSGAVECDRRGMSGVRVHRRVRRDALRGVRVAETELLDAMVTAAQQAGVSLVARLEQLTCAVACVRCRCFANGCSCCSLRNATRRSRRRSRHQHWQPWRRSRHYL